MIPASVQVKLVTENKLQKKLQVVSLDHLVVPLAGRPAGGLLSFYLEIHTLELASETGSLNCTHHHSLLLAKIAQQDIRYFKIV
jgi:hypothetical protein